MTIMELKGLRGLQELDTLLAESRSGNVPAKESILHLSINDLQSGKYQPRTDVNENSLNELASSIQSQGIILPLIVRPIDNDTYEIIAGERRWRAAKIAGLKTVPVIIRNIPDETALAFSLIENIQRESLNPMDEAMAFARLKDDFSMTHEEISERIGRSRSSVTNIMRLLGLCEEVKELLRARKLEMGHARALLSVDFSCQLEIAEHIVAKALSVRETEKIVQKTRQPVSSTSLTNPYHDKIWGWEKLISELLSSNVKINLNNNGDGKIVIHVNTPEEIEWLINIIKNGKN